MLLHFNSNVAGIWGDSWLSMLTFLTFYVLWYRYTYKFCNECGHFNQATRMFERHWKKEHADIDTSKFGFVKDGMKPRTHIDTFNLIL